jgi:hypothetical protein
VGRHRVERIERKPSSPRWGWSGVEKIVPPLWAEAELRCVADLLPSRQSSIENIVAELLAIGGRHHRNLHQDEFGPTQAERMQALRDLVDRLEVLLSRLEALSPQLRLLVSERQTEGRPAAGPIDVDLIASYSADKDAIEAVSEIASDVRRDLAGVGRTDDANLIGEVGTAADMVGPLLWNLDSTTDGDVVIDGESAGSALADNCADLFESLCVPVRRLHSRFTLALIHLGRRKGPEARLSLGLLVSQLCDLWRRETGRPVTANPVKLGVYTGCPQSASGRFVCAAVEALQPSAAWMDEHKAVGPHIRARIMTLPPAYRAQPVHSAMRAYVAADRPDPSAPRRGRPRGK